MILTLGEQALEKMANIYHTYFFNYFGVPVNYLAICRYSSSLISPDDA